MTAGLAVVVMLGGGTWVVRASQSTTPVTLSACVNKKSGAMRMIEASRSCTAAERLVSWNNIGPVGATGAMGASGVNITQLSVCDGIDAGTVADELCKIGMTGPGGGPVFFIDYYDQYPSFCAVGDCNYLEASPADIDEAGGDFTSAWCSDKENSLSLSAWSNSAIGAGRTNTTTADTICTSGAIQTAVDYAAPAFNGVAKDDWWLPSIGELMAMYWNLRLAGVGSFSADYYWSSSEDSAYDAWYQNFYDGSQGASLNSLTFRVRPARGF